MARTDSRTRGAGKRPDYVELAAGIVSAYVGKNAVAAADIPALINEVHAALTRVGRGSDGRGEARKPAVPVKRSVTAEYIVCLEDGKKFKSLRRHLRSQYDMTPEQYRERWGLPPDYPMVAPNYAATRSALAKKMGLGRQRGRRK
jgi:predicted transcriptional regulator